MLKAKRQKIDYLNNQQLRLHPALFTLDFYDATKCLLNVERLQTNFLYRRSNSVNGISIKTNVPTHRIVLVGDKQSRV